MAVYVKNGVRYVGSMAERKMKEDAKKNTTSTNASTTNTNVSSGGVTTKPSGNVASSISRDDTPASSGGNSQYTGSSNAILTNNSSQQAIKDQMNANSIAWWSADDAGKKQLEAANQSLAAQLGGSVSYDPATGYWSGTASTWDDNYNISNPKSSYNRPYDAEMENLLNEILNRKDFSYDVMNDPLYQQYAAMYRREGDRAMKETMAEAAAGAGGMNTYAITAAQQANNYYNSQLNDKIPQLYQLAYEMYLNDKESKVQDLGLLQQMDATQYGRYRDTINDYYNDRNFAYGVYRDDVADSQWQATFDNNNYWANKEFDYNVGRDTIADGRYEDETSYNRNLYDRKSAKEEVWKYIEMGITPSAELIARAGMSESDVSLAVAAVQAQLAAQGISSGGSRSSSGGNGYTGKGTGTGNGNVYTGGSGSGSAIEKGDVEDDTVVETPANSQSSTSDISVENAVATLLKTKGKGEAFAYLKEALTTGAIQQGPYMMLYAKYFS